MKLHIFTLNWNGKEKLRQLSCTMRNNINYLIKQNILNENHDNYNWLIRDHLSTDGSVDFDNFMDNTDIIQIGHNRNNFAQGMNFLFNKANPADDDLILLLNNDVALGSYNTKETNIIGADNLFKMISLMRKTNAAIVGARLLYPGTNKLQHAGVIFGQRFGNMPYHFRHQEESDKNTERNRYFQAVTAAVCLVKASVWREVGGMNEGYNWAFEDIDFCLRAGSKNHKIIYCGDTTIYHGESETLKKNPVNKLFLRQNVELFKKTWFGKYKLDHELYLKGPNYNIIL